MYAVIEDSGSQYKISEGDVIRVDLRDLDENQKTIEFDRVLLVGGTEDAPKVGQPTIQGAKVTGEIIDEVKGDKITIIKFKRRNSYRRKNGHRQRFLKVKVAKIEA